MKNYCFDFGEDITCSKSCSHFLQECWSHIRFLEKEKKKGRKPAGSEVN